MKPVYLLATPKTEPLELETLREALEDEDVEFVVGGEADDFLFSVRVNGARTDVDFQALEEALEVSDELVSGSEESLEGLRRAKAVYRFSFEPGKPQSSVAVFEALWCVRAVMEQVPSVLLDVTAFKVHDPKDVEEITELDFDIRDHISLHAVEVSEGETPLWVHSHGMEKFGARDLEAFHLSEDDLPPLESFLHQLATDLAFGHGPQWRSIVETGDGDTFMLVPAEESRHTLLGVPMEAFDGHEGLFLSVVSGTGRHTLTSLLSQYRERFEDEPPERAQALREQASELLPTFKARFLRRGLMEPLGFVVRAPFEVHPSGEEPGIENLWVEILTWEDAAIVGKLVDGGTQTTEWRKGAHVEVDERQINAVAITRDGRTLDDDETRALLGAELPA